jgi:NADP-dependent 3-hydroxy acid dehydrogenase YdfG
MSSARRTALVTGASSGIGAATARRLSKDGYLVYCVARRQDRIRDLAAEIDGVAVTCDVTDDDQVASLAREVGEVLHLLVNNAGAALGVATVDESDPRDWRKMYDLNVLGTLRVTRALLPRLLESGDATVVNLGSTAGHEVYVRGGGYVASKHALASLTQSLRRELLGRAVRVTEVAPGMVKTDEFSVHRYGGDRQAADAVYAGVDEPLTAEDVAECVAWVASRPPSVNVDLMVVRPRAQVSQYEVHRVFDQH